MQNIKDKKSQEIFPEISDTVSSTECTGIMPIPPADSAELDSYQELYSMQIPKKNTNYNKSAYKNKTNSNK